MFAFTTVKALTLWRIINAEITSLILMDRKAKFQIGSDQNKKHRVWCTAEKDFHTVVHAYMSEVKAKLCPLTVASLATDDSSYLVTEDKNLPFLKPAYTENDILFYYKARPFQPFAVVMREDKPEEKESAASNFNSLLYLRLRYPECFLAENKWHSRMIIIGDGGDGIGNQHKDVQFVACLVFIMLCLQYLFIVKHAKGKSYKNVAEHVNGAMELAITGQPITLKVNNMAKASENERNEAMEEARVEHITRIHGQRQPCCHSKLIALAP